MAIDKCAGWTSMAFLALAPNRPNTSRGFKRVTSVRAVVTSGKKSGVYVGRVAVRASGSFNITTTSGVVQGISHHSCMPLHRCDGYGYCSLRAAFHSSRPVNGDGYPG